MRVVESKRDLNVAPNTLIGSINSTITMIENRLERMWLSWVDLQRSIATPFVACCPVSPITDGNQVIVVKTQLAISTE